MDMTKKFQHVFPVGVGCNMAAGLSRIGLREYSGPFDWIMAGMDDVITLLDTDFADFLNPEYLKSTPVPFNAGKCINTKFEMIQFVHDFAPEEDAPPLSEQLGAVQAKYQRRIDYYMQALKEPTLVCRLEYGGKEDYWRKNYHRVSEFFKKFNPENELIIISYGEPNTKLDADFPMYFCEEIYDDHVLGYFIETNDELSAFLHREDLIPIEQRAKNLRFFIDKQLPANRDISVNEVRIARDKLQKENTVWQDWMNDLHRSDSYIERLKAEGIKKVGFIGCTQFFEPLVDQLRAADISCEFVMSWNLFGKGDLAHGVPIYCPQELFRPQETEEERKKRTEEFMQLPEAQRELYWQKRFASMPKVKEVDAIIGVDVANTNWLGKARAFLSCKLYMIFELWSN